MLTENLKKLTYRLHYRGIKELDIFFGRVTAGLPQLSPAEVSLLEQLTDEPESNIYSWVLGYEPAPTTYEKLLVKLLTY